MRLRDNQWAAGGHASWLQGTKVLKLLVHYLEMEPGRSLRGSSPELLRTRRVARRQRDFVGVRNNVQTTLDVGLSHLDLKIACGSKTY